MSNLNVKGHIDQELGPEAYSSDADTKVNVSPLKGFDRAAKDEKYGQSQAVAGKTFESNKVYSPDPSNGQRAISTNDHGFAHARQSVIEAKKNVSPEPVAASEDVQGLESLYADWIEAGNAEVALDSDLEIKYMDLAQDKDAVAALEKEYADWIFEKNAEYATFDVA